MFNNNNISKDEEILYGCYKKMGEMDEKKKKEVDSEGDKSLISGIVSKTSLMLMRLTDEDIRLTMTEVQKYLINAKGLIHQYHLIKGRNPGYICQSLTESIDKLTRAVAHHEAEMLSFLRNQEEEGDKIDILKILEKKTGRLNSVLARDLIRESINKGIKPLITERDKKDYVTVFVDEAIRPVEWDENGLKGKTGSFSYIICSGYLDSEKQIREEKKISKGVDYTKETVHIERITETAIGKVLMSLAYDHEFTGNVQIYTDNKGASNKWDQMSKNAKLASLFESVKVSYIPRENNKEADRLGRTRVHLDMPTYVYEKTVKKAGHVKELEEKLEMMRINREKEERIKSRRFGYIMGFFGLGKKKPAGRDFYMEPLAGSEGRSVA